MTVMARNVADVDYAGVPPLTLVPVSSFVNRRAITARGEYCACAI